MVAKPFLSKKDLKEEIVRHLGKYISLSMELFHIFNKLVDQRLEEITNLDKKVNPDDLIYRYKGFTADAKFNECDNDFSLLDGKVSLADAKNDQAEFKSNLSKIKKETKNIDQKQKNALYNIEMLCKARNSVIQFFDDYSSMVSEAKLKATKGTGLKILTSNIKILTSIASKITNSSCTSKSR